MTIQNRAFGAHRGRRYAAVPEVKRSGSAGEGPGYWEGESSGSLSLLAQPCRRDQSVLSVAEFLPFQQK